MAAAHFKTAEKAKHQKQSHGGPNCLPVKAQYWRLLTLVQLNQQIRTERKINNCEIVPEHSARRRCVLRRGTLRKSILIFSGQSLSQSPFALTSPLSIGSGPGLGRRLYRFRNPKKPTSWYWKRVGDNAFSAQWTTVICGVTRQAPSATQLFAVILRVDDSSLYNQMI